MKLTEEGFRLIQQWEGLRLTAYKDSVGVWTIGFGHSEYAPTGPKPHRGMTISKEEAQRFLRADLSYFASRLKTMVHVDLTPNQFSALLSFMFNVGETNFRRSTLLKKLNRGDYDSVPSELAKWVKGGGQRLQGLVNRRAAEAGLWAKGDYVASRDVGARPETLPVISRETVSWGAGIAGTLGTLFMGSGPVQWAFAAVIVLGFAAGAYFFIKARMER